MSRSLHTMKVALVVSSEEDGGAARSTYLLARFLPEHGITAHVVLHRDGELAGRLRAAGLPFDVMPELIENLARRAGAPESLTNVPANLRSLRQATRRLRVVAEREDVRFLYGQGTWANLTSALAARTSRNQSGNIGVAWHIRNDHRAPLTRWLMRSVARAARVDAVVAVSRSAAQPYQGLPLPLAVVPNGADLDASDAARRAPRLRERLGLPQQAVVAGYAGRLLPHKGIHVLIEAARLALPAEPGLHLVVFGGNPAHTGEDVLGRLQQTIATAGLSGRVHFPGYVNEIEAHLAGLDFAIVPSICAECCSRTVVESLALGLPVIASRIGGNPELVRDNGDGLLVEPNDARALAQAMLELARDADRRRAMAEAALAVRHRFDARGVARQVADILCARALDRSSDRDQTATRSGGSAREVV